MRVVGRPVILANEVDFVHALDKGDVLLQFRVIWRIVMIREDIDGGDVEMGFVDTVGSVHYEFVRREFLDEGGDFRCPSDGHFLIAEDGTAELVACFVGDDSGILGVGEASVGVYVGEEVENIVLEVLDDGWVGVEFLDKRVHFGRITGGDVYSS